MQWNEFFYWKSAVFPGVVFFAAVAWIVSRLERAERQIDRLELQFNRYVNEMDEDENLDV